MKPLAGWPAVTIALVTGAAAAHAASAAADDPVVAQARKLAAEGRFADAQRCLEDRSDTPDPAAARRRDDELEILRRIRLDFRLDETQLLQKLRASIPDAEPADLKRWREAGVLQFRRIDGETLYYIREPSNLFRLSEEARRRRDQASTSRPAKKGEEFDRAAMAETILREAERRETAEVQPVRHRIAYAVTLTPKQHALRAGSRVRIWLPYPQAYRQQRDIRLVRANPEPVTISPNWDEAKHRELQRTLYFEPRIDDPAAPPRVEAVFEYTCSAYAPRPDAKLVQPYRADDEYRYWTAERPPHIVFSPEIRRVIEAETAGITNPLEKARKLFAFVTRHMTYVLEVEYSTIPSLSEKAIHTGRGDCGVHAMLFITLCRAAGVPARWQTGWQTEPGGVNMHDWVEFYVEPWGWLPADPTHGFLKSEDPRVREFFFGNLDPYRLIVNLDHSSPLVPAKETLRSEPVDFQRGEVEVDGVNWYYDEWDYDFRVEYLDP